MARVRPAEGDKWIHRAMWRIFRKGAVIEQTSVGALPHGDLVFWQKTPDKKSPDVVIIPADRVDLMQRALDGLMNDAFIDSQFQMIDLYKEQRG